MDSTGFLKVQLESILQSWGLEKKDVNRIIRDKFFLRKLAESCLKIEKTDLHYKCLNLLVLSHNINIPYHIKRRLTRFIEREDLEQELILKNLLRFFLILKLSRIYKKGIPSINVESTEDLKKILKEEFIKPYGMKSIFLAYAEIFKKLNEYFKKANIKITNKDILLYLHDISNSNSPSLVINPTFLAFAYRTYLTVKNIFNQLSLDHQNLRNLRYILLSVYWRDVKRNYVETLKKYDENIYSKLKLAIDKNNRELARDIAKELGNVINYIKDSINKASSALMESAKLLLGYIFWDYRIIKGIDHKLIISVIEEYGKIL